MSSSALDTMDSFNMAILLLTKCKRRKRRRKRYFWVHPINVSRLTTGIFYTLMDDLKNDDRKFFNYFRMSKGSFYELLNIPEPHIRRQDTPMRASSPAEERLAMTYTIFCRSHFLCAYVSIYIYIYIYIFMYTYSYIYIYIYFF